MLNDIIENANVSRLVAGFARSPLQLNDVHTSDAEVIDLSGTSGSGLAITTDTIAEEIQSGLYTDPYLIGWMTVMVNLSDLAAVGADPLGLVIAQTFPPDLPDEDIAGIQKGIADACGRCGTYVLGGDSNSGPQLSLTATAIGITQTGCRLSRKGCAPGDVVFVSGPVGGGSAYAFARLTGVPGPAYQPVARVREAGLLRSYASSCMDTSDGLLATLDQLMRVNGVGITLDAAWEETLTPEARSLADQAGILPWMVIAGEHGEFELTFTVPESRVQPFLADARRSDWEPIQIGRVSSDARLLIPSDGRVLIPDTTLIRNSSEIARRDVDEYLDVLRSMESNFILSTES